MPRLHRPGSVRQGERLSPQFQEIKAAFDAKRMRLAEKTPDEVDPELVVVFDIAGTVKDFQNAIDKIPGFEFLSQSLGDESDPDDDFHMVKADVGRTQ